jgi:hypothetical protein
MIWFQMADVQVLNSPTTLPQNTFLAICGVLTPFTGFPVGTPVYQTAIDGSVNFARANAASTARVVGIASTAGAVGQDVEILRSGPLTLSEDEWDVITGGEGGLTIGVPYYVSAATAGLLTKTAPSGPNYVAPVGIATSPTTLLVQITFPVEA